MGLIFSRFYEKPSTRDTLERIEQELQNIEERRLDKIKREKFIVQILSFIPITILIANVCILVYPSESSFRDKIVLSVPVVILNLILWVSQKIVQWYSRWSVENEDARLRKLHKEKKRILDMVCETESYRVATELLEKYDPKQLRRREKALERPTSPFETSLAKITASPIKSPVQQTNIAASQSHYLNQSLSFISQSQPQLPTNPLPPPPPPTPSVSKPIHQSTQPSIRKVAQTPAGKSNLHNVSVSSVATSRIQGRPVRPILSKDRTLFEKVIDWVVSDGPDNRFALICRFCYGHNGMSLAEEYETINFRCCYCYNLNTATNKKSQVHDQLQSEREKMNSDGAPSGIEDDQKDKKSDDKHAVEAVSDDKKPTGGKKKKARSKESPVTLDDSVEPAANPKDEISTIVEESPNQQEKIVEKAIGDEAKGAIEPEK